MGNDGGSIPTRRELVKEAAKALTTQQVKEVQNEQQEYAWNHDPITRKPLSKPVVSDSLGKLYNKDTIIEYLLSEDGDAKKTEAESILQGRVKSLKDVVEVKFEVDNGGVNAAEEANGPTVRSEKWICPITNRELGPSAKAVYLVPCGHAFAGSVVREVSGETCLQCNETYAENDVIPILPTVATDIARLSLRMKTLKENNLTHSLKKAKGDKKRKKHAEKETNGATVALTSKEQDRSSEEDKKKDKPKQKPTINENIKSASTASLTKKVLEEQEARNKRRKLEQNDNVKSLFSNRDKKPSASNSADYMTRGFSISSKR
ncbi:Rtf2 RING-finger-domain-containing protein [Clohesyomyces aquaticus]|uniref:Rtf2 RING-finger-domain-containing protein n=1 Tax=Clohesyomyces aquaticus TaxID=1231657 RepID=A0A1Y1ZKQ8_9PLEO|nr:Rtf2 RING-finger-domain-containing protein [Clohesyomyces aquaticus]